ncbi:MAG: MFS transporter [Deltaproteobacteria bacterium]|nr:MFS transporter [Deltaproteobacteria bacterium]
MQKIELHQQPYRWVMLAILWLSYFSFGAVSRSLAPLVTPILKDLRMTYSQMGFVLGSWQLTYIVLAVMAGVILDRWGIRKSIFAGVIIVGLSAALRSLSIGFGTLLAFVALFGAGGPMISIGCPKTISRWFKGKERGMAVGIYMTGPWLGGTITLAVTNSMVMPLLGFSWRLTFVFYGLTTCLAATLWWLLKILENAGMSPARAGMISSIPVLAGIPAVLTIPRMVPHRYRGRFIGLSAIIAGAGILWITVWHWPIIPGLVIFGVSATVVLPMLVLTLMETPEVALRYFGSATGVFFCVSEIGGFSGPFIVGFLMDLTENFRAGTIFLSILGLIIFILMALMRGNKSPKS